jgi:hypothetical protein
MNRFLIFLILFATYLFIISCNEKQEISREYPLIVTKDAEVTQEGVKLNAEVIVVGGEEDIRYGFVWHDAPDPTLENGIYMFVDQDMINKKFHLKIHCSLAKSVVYYARAFVETTQMVIYANEVTFVSNGSLPPLISNFYPKVGFRAQQSLLKV